MASDFWQGLGNLGEIVQGADRSAYNSLLRQLAVQQLQQAQTQQQGRASILPTLRALSGLQQQTAPPGPTPLPQPVQQEALPPLPPNMANLPQVPDYSQSFADGSGVRGSWFGNYQGAQNWRDPSDSGLQAGGAPVSAGPGIALPSRSTLGQTFDVTAPSGKTYQLPQTDIGPAKWTGRGVDINAPAAEAMGYTPQNFPTDASFRVQLASADQTYQQLKRAISPDDIQPTTQGTRETLSSMGNPLQFAGRMNFGDLIKAIDKANPTADDTIKSAIFTNLYPMLNNQGKLDFQQAIELFKVGQTEKHQTVMEETARRREDTAEQRLRDLESRPVADPSAKGWQIMQTPEGGAIRVNPNTGETQPINLPVGTTRMGTQQAGQKAPQSEVDYWSTVLKNGGTLPAGLTRTRQGADLIRQIMANMGQSGDPNDFIANIATKKAESSSLNNMMRMADAATSFEQTASRNFDLALSLSKNAVPTEWGPFLNSFIEKGETQAGNTNVPPYVAALLTAANEYAKIMSGSTGAQGSTVDSRREAAELFSPYLSANQIERVVAIAKADMANRKQSLYGQIDDITSRLRAAGSKAPSATRGQAPSPGTAGQDFSKMSDDDILKALGIKQ